MAARIRRHNGGNGLDAWPGYVDALSTLLMVIIFVLLVFVLGQAFLSVALNGRDKALDKLTHQVAELSDMLALERGHGAELQASVAQLARELAARVAAADALTAQVSSLQAQAANSATERAGLIGARDQLAAQLSDTQARLDAAAGTEAGLNARLAELSARADDGTQLAEARQQIEAMRAQSAELDRTVQADRATIEARLSDLAKLADQVKQLTALRDELEAQAKDAAARATTQEQARAAVAAQLADEQKFSDSARAQVALLNRQIEEMRAQIGQLSAALDASDKAAAAKDLQISNLGARLNAALATKVEELQHYRSEFFGRLRDVLADRPGIQIVGDRFVFQSEVLFAVGSAELTRSGTEQVQQLATTLKQISKEIPKDINWLLRVDGHADRQKVHGTWASNWELSAARAITVVKLLIAEGVPAAHLAATGFGDNQPLDPAETPAAYARNRRIELRLTDR